MLFAIILGVYCLGIMAGLWQISGVLFLIFAGVAVIEGLIEAGA